MSTLSLLKTPLAPRALVLGGSGGIALVLVMVFNTRGPLGFLPYVALLTAIAALLARHRTLRFGQRFAAAFAAFGLATLISFSYVVFFANPGSLGIPDLGGLLRFAFVAGILALLSAAAAYVTE